MTPKDPRPPIDIMALVTQPARPSRLRDMVRAAEIIEAYNEITERLAQAALGKTTKDAVTGTEYPAMTAFELEAAKVFIQAARIGLAKVCPDLRAIEHSGEISAPELTRQQLIDRLAHIHARTTPRLIGPGAGGAGAADGAADKPH